MKESLRLVGVMAVFSLVAGILLALTNTVTREPIEKAGRSGMVAVLKRALPEADNDPLAETRTVGENRTFHIGRTGGRLTGLAFQTLSQKGYGGPIEVMVALTPEGTVRSVEILSAAKETPGLGTKIAEPSWLAQFKGRDTQDTAWARVTKDGGAIQGVTGATISSRAVAEAVRNGLDAFSEHRAELLDGARARE
jgi:Na+-translocating ferredoxin:NAD+ oxidoreductase subunit G